jgi:hypothetical protein
MRKSTSSDNRSYKSRFSCPWSNGNLSLLWLGVLVIILQRLLTEIDRNENTTRKRYMDLGESRGLYSQKFDNKRKAQDETGSEMSSEAITPHGGAARRGLVPLGGEVPLGTVSYPFPSHNFPYLIKFNANFFLLKLLPIRKRALQFPAFVLW